MHIIRSFWRFLLFLETDFFESITQYFPSKSHWNTVLSKSLSILHQVYQTNLFEFFTCLQHFPLKLLIKNIYDRTEMDAVYASCEFKKNRIWNHRGTQAYRKYMKSISYKFNNVVTMVQLYICRIKVCWVGEIWWNNHGIEFSEYRTQYWMKF